MWSVTWRVLPVRRAVAAAGTALVLASCGSGASSGPTADSSPPRSGDATTTPITPPTTASATPTGSAEHPVVVPPQQGLLRWTRVSGSTKVLVTTNGPWTLQVAEGGAGARLEGPSGHRTVRAGDHASITDAFLTDRYALVVSEDRLAEQPDVATVVDLASGRLTTLDGSSDPPTVVGGTWALGPDSLVHATSGSRHSYCLATVELPAGTGTTGWCAPPRHGFSRATITGSATTMMVFDDHHPSCRSLAEVEGTRLVTIPGVTRCKGWDSSLDASGAVWSVVPKDRRIEAARFYAHDAAGWFDLGPGTSGSLVTCDGRSFFTRDPAAHSDPAELLRWDPDGSTLTVVYRTRATGNAFLSPPRCGGTHLTLTAYSSAGDEQVTTDLG
jgi:hypothetical protein